MYSANLTSLKTYAYHTELGRLNETYRLTDHRHYVLSVTNSERPAVLLSQGGQVLPLFSLNHSGASLPRG